MATDMFLDLGQKIKGEAIDAAFKDTIQVLAWSWGLSNSGTFHMASGGGAGKANFQDISFTKYIDTASCPLISACGTGEHITTAKLVVRKAGGKPIIYWTMTMTNVLVTSYSTGGSGGEDQLTENFSLNFQKFKIEYAKQNEKGMAQAAGNVSWDIAKGAAS
jgi:type VI secretion system secreted protein Hcp